MPYLLSLTLLNKILAVEIKIKKSPIAAKTKPNFGWNKLGPHTYLGSRKGEASFLKTAVKTRKDPINKVVILNLTAFEYFS